MNPKINHALHIGAIVAAAALAGVVSFLADSGWPMAAVAIPVLNYAIRALGKYGAASVLLVGIGLAGNFIGCATTSTPDGGTSPATTFGHCSSEALKTAGQGLVGQVMTALATGDYVDELAKLGKQVGAAEVGCAVDLAIAELTGMHGAAPNEPVVKMMLERGQAWRGANP